MKFHPYNPTSPYGWTECRDLQEQEALICYSKYDGNYHVRAAMLNSIMQTSSTAPCVVNITQADVDGFVAKYYA